MNVFDLAKQREEMMEKLYIDLAQSAKHIGLKRIFEMLAKEEGKHVRVVEGIKKQTRNEDPDKFYIDVKEILTDVREKKDFFGLETNQVELYKKVRDEEKLSEELYLTEAHKTEKPELKKTLLAFAEEEHKHYLLMEEIVQFVERPDVWVGSSEFSNIEQF